MRTAFRTFVIFIIGLIIGAGGLWIAAHFTKLPGGKNTSISTTPPAQTQSNNKPQNTSNQRNQTITATSSLIAGFPGDIPIYQPATLLTSSKTTHGSAAVVYSASYTSPQSASDVINYYKGQFSANGWRLISQKQTDDTTMLQATSNDHRQADVLITQLPGTSNGAQSAFQLTITPNSQNT